LGLFIVDLKKTTKTRNNRSMDGTKRADIKEGYTVEVVQKHHQRTGELTEGEVQRILTKSPNHPHGIKVKLSNGIVGRVKNILEEDEL
jgi:uncharacterized repeat protein (TIGR03833 family)